MLKFITNSAEETENFGKNIANLLRGGDIISFGGDLGVGKTCMIRGIAQGLGVKSNVTSSSFVLMRVLHGRLPVFHFDLYRLSNADELFDIGYDEFLFSNGVSLIEWSDRLGNLIGNSFLHIELEYDFDDSKEDGGICQRIITLTPHGDRFQKLIEELKNENFNNRFCF